MKKNLILITILFYSLLTFSQTKKLKNGTYSAYNSDKILNVLIQDEKLFLYIYPFEYTMKNDSIVTIKNQKPTGFSVTYSFDKDLEVNKIKVNAINYLFSVNDMFIATEAEKAKSNYQSLSAIRKKLSVEGNLGNETDITSFTIEKTKNITLVKEDNFQKTGEVATFDIPDNVNVINIEYTDDNNFMNLSGVFNESKNNLTLFNDAKEPMIFKYNKESRLADVIKPKETLTQRNWIFRGKTSKYAEESNEMTVDTAAVKVDLNYKHFIGKNFQEALKHNSKSPEKFLVVLVDLKNKNRQLQFDDFIKRSENQLNYQMGDRINEDFVHYNYYLASEKDKNLLAKYKIKSDSEILIFTNNGDLIYHLPESFMVNENLFILESQLLDEFVRAKQELEFDKVMLNKKASTKEVLRMLSIAPSLEIKAIPLIEKERVLDAIKEVPANEVIEEKTMTDEERERLSKEISPPTIPEVEPVTIDFDYYNPIKNKENLYRLKSTLKDANEKWEKIVVAFEKSNKIDEDFITVVKQQLNDKGFSKKIFDQSSFKIEDYRMLNYVFANYKTLNQEPEVKDNPATAFEPKNAAEKAVNEAARVATDAAAFAIKPYENQYNEKIIYVLEEYFSRFANEIDLNDKDIKNQKSIKFLLFEYYKKFVQLTDYKTTLVNNYLNVLDDNLKDPEYKKEYYEIFEIYFNKIMAPNKSIIENLDLDYSLNDNDYWNSYKNNFANNCNLIAWEIVKNPNDKTLILKAIKWSETSVEIEKNTHYYYDTLARLYYLSNQKEKAIATQQKAIDLGVDSENGAEYKDVLQQMKNGTYTLPISKE